MKRLCQASTRSVVVVALILGLGGCASTASQLSGAAVEGSVSTIEQPENLDRIDNITSSPEFQRSIERVGASMVRGVSSEAAKVDVDVDALVGTTEELGLALGRGLARGFKEGLGDMPSPGAIVDDTITGALTSVAKDENQERARAIITNVMSTMVRTALASTAEGLDEDLSPSIDRASSTAAPKLAKLLANEEMRGALGGMVREVSRNATLGFDSGMEQVRESNRAEQEGILGRGALVSVLASAVALLLAAIIAIIMLVVANNRRRHEREDMLTSMLIAFAGHGAGLDEATRAELLRNLGVSSWPTRKEDERLGELRGPGTGPASVDSETTMGMGAASPSTGGP
jgi:hypothetical protein